MSEGVDSESVEEERPARQRGTLMKCIVFIAIALVAGCATYSYVNHGEYASVATINMGLLDSLEVDTTKWAEEYEAFIKEVNPTNRNVNDINEVLQKNAKDIIASVNRFAQKAGCITTDSVWFDLSHDGSLMITSITSKSIADTNELKKIKRTLSKVRFGPSKEGKYLCRFSVMVRGTGTLQTIQLYPTILFGIRGRAKSDIMQTVMKYVQNMRTAYNRRLYTTPGIMGKVMVKFAINRFGQVLNVHMESSTLTDDLLDSAIVQQVRHWKFDPILTNGDVTEVVYPFVFSQ